MGRDLNSSGISQHPGFYLPDGDIVISAKSRNNDTQLFRVHRFLLCYHSPVFKDMFLLSSPDDNEKHDGVPVVNLPDDAADVASLLNFLYKPG